MITQQEALAIAREVLEDYEGEVPCTRLHKLALFVDTQITAAIELPAWQDVIERIEKLERVVAEAHRNTAQMVTLTSCACCSTYGGK